MRARGTGGGRVALGALGARGTGGGRGALAGRAGRKKSAAVWQRFVRELGSARAARGVRGGQGAYMLTKASGNCLLAFSTSALTSP